MEEKEKQQLFEKCGKCGEEIPKFAEFEVYKHHYDGECVV